MDAPVTARSRKGERTRALILRTAVDLFCEQGYEAATMRAIAERAGVSLGNAYYYFRSKEQLIQAFYERVHEEHMVACRPILDQETGLKARLLGVIRVKLTVSEPYHRFAGLLFKSAADPLSPLSPFGSESHPVRQQTTAIFAEVLAGARTRVPKDLQAELPNLLWLYHMGIVLYWIHDQSPGRVRTHRLADHTVDLVVRAIQLASHPFMGPFRRTTLRLLAELRQEPSLVSPEQTARAP